MLLALAALNRFRLTPALARDEQGRAALKRSILLECAIALGILAVVAGWRFTPPPRTIVPETPLAIHIHTDKAMFQVLVSPGKPGVDDFVLQLMTGEATPLKAKEATLTLSLPERGIEPMERRRRARAGRLLARAQGRAALRRPLACADRRAGDRFREDHAGGRARCRATLEVGSAQFMSNLKATEK